MPFAAFLRKQSALLWRFLGFFQTPGIRLLHALAAVLVILQILSGLAIHFPAPAGSSALNRLLSWYHIGAGITTALMALLFAGTSLTQRGPRYFFPYLWGDVDQLKRDLMASLRLKMVPPRAQGLATTVQGLGLGALLLAALSGLLWFLLWRGGSSFAGGAHSAHIALAVLMEIYLLGHGGMALLHFFVWQRKVRQK